MPAGFEAGKPLAQPFDLLGRGTQLLLGRRHHSLDGALLLPRRRQFGVEAGEVGSQAFECGLIRQDDVATFVGEPLRAAVELPDQFLCMNQAGVRHFEPAAAFGQRLLGVLEGAARLAVETIGRRQAGGDRFLVGAPRFRLDHRVVEGGTGLREGVFEGLAALVGLGDLGGEAVQSLLGTLAIGAQMAKLLLDAGELGIGLIERALRLVDAVGRREVAFAQGFERVFGRPEGGGGSIEVDRLLIEFAADAGALRLGFLLADEPEPALGQTHARLQVAEGFGGG